MSVTLPPRGLSNPRTELWLITVVVVIVIKCSAVAEIVGAYADVVGLATALLAGLVPRKATARTADELSGP